jgi:hypothetical protein
MSERELQEKTIADYIEESRAAARDIPALMESIDQRLKYGEELKRRRDQMYPPKEQTATMANLFHVEYNIEDFQEYFQKWFKEVGNTVVPSLYSIYSDRCLLRKEELPPFWKFSGDGFVVDLRGKPRPVFRLFLNGLTVMVCLIYPEYDIRVIVPESEWGEIGRNSKPEPYIKFGADKNGS